MEQKKYNYFKGVLLHPKITTKIVLEKMTFKNAMILYIIGLLLTWLTDMRGEGSYSFSETILTFVILPLLIPLTNFVALRNFTKTVSLKVVFHSNVMMYLMTYILFPFYVVLLILFKEGYFYTDQLTGWHANLNFVWEYIELIFAIWLLVIQIAVISTIGKLSITKSICVSLISLLILVIFSALFTGFFNVFS